VVLILMKCPMDKIYHCKLCKYHSGLEEFVLHVKSEHKIGIKKYFENNCPKFDLWTKHQIPYKSIDQYEQTDFLNKKNLKLWLARLNLNGRIQYLEEKIKQHMLLKKAKKSPGYIESCLINQLPSVKDIESLCEINYNEFCKKINVECKFDYSNIKILEGKIDDKNTIIVDTREQKPFNFKGKSSKNLKLEYGDYALESNTKIAIERKCYSDFIGTFSSDVPRFVKELERAKKDNGYIVVVCESTLNNILYSKFKRYGKASPHFISHNLRALLREHDNLQFVFCSSRREAEEKSLQILSWGDSIRNIDLQYYFNYGANSRTSE